MAAIFMLLSCIATRAEAQIDLSRASVERLDNGLTLIMLEDRTFPVVSIQTTYRTGAKDDPAGRLGLAHFFEHMAFRGSKNFPDLGLTNEIYAAGGEWHGYTWIDNTNYFATAPKAELPLLLDIDADRMARLDLREEDIEAERGAVLAEMNGYANDPDSTLFDALMAAHFMTHPYRNNTIGYASDIGAITHEDVVDFYERNYAPQNAILAIVGDFDRQAARALVKKKFGKIKKKTRPRAPLTAEFPRTGDRRVTISLPSDETLFKIAWPAPATSHPDFPAFLILQALIGGSAGVNFNQNDWGTPVPRASPIYHAADGVKTWIIPTAESYAFVISGGAPNSGDKQSAERVIQAAFDKIADGEFFRDAPADPNAREQIAAQVIDLIKEHVLAALALDIETTEDAAHQLAYFAGIGAFEELLSLETSIRAVTPNEVKAIARKYLAANQRTIAWLDPGAAPAASETPAFRPAAPRRGTQGEVARAPRPVMIASNGGAPVLLQQSDFSSTVSMEALLDGRFSCRACTLDYPAFGLTTVSIKSGAAQLGDLSFHLARAVNAATPITHAPPSASDPLTRLDEEFAAAFARADGSRKIIVVAASGALDESSARRLADDLSLATTAPVPQASAPDIGEDREIILGAAKAQDAVGFMAPAPAANAPGALATSIALYVLSHGYGGRLGEEAIARRGLANYIDTQYRTGVSGGAVTIATGVDPEKVDAFRHLMKAEIASLKTEPSTDAEIAEAKRHLLGRKISAAQSNEEIADAMIRDFLAVGRPESAEEFAARLEKVTREDVLNAIVALQKGAVVTVRGEGLN